MTGGIPQHGRKRVSSLLLASFGWGRRVEAVSVGWNPDLHIWSYFFPVLVIRGGKHMPSTLSTKKRFQPEDTLWLIDRLALGLLDGMTGNILGSKICGVDAKDGSMDWVHVHSGGTA
jgi:hypothetical protein